MSYALLIFSFVKPFNLLRGACFVQAAFLSACVLLAFIGSLAAEETFTAAAPLHHPRQEHTAILLPGSRVVVAGGRNGSHALASAEMYDGGTGAWIVQGSMHQARTGHCAVLLNNGKILVVGGADSAGTPLASAELFDSATGVWTRTGTMATARKEHSATLLPDGRVVVIGGTAVASGSMALKSCEIYNPATGMWAALQDMPKAWRQHSVVLHSENILVIGGKNEEGFNTTEELLQTKDFVWNPFPLSGPPDNLPRLVPHLIELPGQRVLIDGGTQNGEPQAATAFLNAFMQWQNGAPMPTARARHAAALLADGRVLVSGGVGASGALLAPSAIRSAAGAWSVAAVLQTARADHTATTLPDGKVLIAGGVDGAGALASCELFAARPAEWADGPPLTTGRGNHSLTLLPDGSLLAAGGYDRHGITLSANAERLFPGGSWENAGAFAKRQGHTATLLADGKVLFAGGNVDDWGSYTTLERVEIYDPATNQWAEAAPLPQARYNHVAVLLLDGRVLVAGGSRNTNDTLLDTAFLYDPQTGGWSATGSMVKSRWLPSASILRDGRVLLLGRGLHETDVSAEIYDPATGIWSASGPMNGSYEHSESVLLADGRVLAVSGPGDPSESKAEIYDPALDRWTVLSRPQTSRYLSSLTLLTDGRVMIGGEQSIPHSISGTTEIYDPVANQWSTTQGPYFLWGIPSVRTDGKVIIVGGQRTLDSATRTPLVYDPLFQQRGVSSPVIQSATFDRVGRLVLTGSGFGTNPVVRWQRLEGGWIRDLAAESATLPTDGNFTSEILSGLPAGHALVTVLADGIPSESVILAPPAARLKIEWPELSSWSSPYVYFDSVALGGTKERVITLHNTGNALLTGLSFTLAGEDASEFALVSSPLPESLPAGQSVALVVACQPQSPGFRSAQLRIASNDPDTPLFTLGLSGSGSSVTPLPALSSIADQEIEQGGAIEPLAFTLSGTDTPELYYFAVTSNNPSLIDGSGLTVIGTGAERTLTVFPSTGASGTATLTVRAASMNEGLQTSTSFQLTVHPVKVPPTLAAISAPPSLREGDADVAVFFSGASAGSNNSQPLTVTAVSSNPQLLGNVVVNHAGGASSGSVRFVPLPGQSGVADITVTVSDGESTASQTFSVRVLPQINALSSAIAEGNSGLTPLSFRVFVGSPQPEPVRVSYTATAGTAQAGVDFQAVSGTAIIPAGAIETVIAINVMGDTAFEFDETFALALSDPVGGFLSGPVILTGTILNDDAQPSLTVKAGSVTEAEPATPAGALPFQAWVSATLAAPSALPLSWTVATREGAAREGSDFVPLGPATLAFAPGETSKWIAVGIKGTEPGGGEGDEEFYVDFTPSEGPGAAITSTCTIRQLAVRDFIPLGSGLHALRFPTGVGQNYLIEESSLLSGEWTPSSSVLTGSGSVVTQVVFSTDPAVFFRVMAMPSAPAAADVGP